MANKPDRQVNTTFASTQALDLHGHQPASAPDPRAPVLAAQRALRLYVRGFSDMERQLLDGTVRLSQRRTPRLEMAGEHDGRSADVVMIDGADNAAVAWAESQDWLRRSTVIWINSAVPRPGHLMARRPVQWPTLPMLLARALEQGLSARAGPRRPDRAEPAAPARNSAAARPVLVVDDSLAVRAYLRSQLEARGIQIAEAQNVQEALNCVTRAAFACVLMDVLMPGVDGYEGCRQIKARLRGSANVPVIMLTSKASPFDRIRGKMAGCDAYLTKPIDPNQLHEVLARHVAMTTERAAAPANTSAAYGAPVAVRV